MTRQAHPPGSAPTRAPAQGEPAVVIEASLPGARAGDGRRQTGFSYVEVLVAVTLLAVALVPAMDALQTGLLGASVHERLAAQHYRAAGRLEELLAQPYGALDAAALAAASATTPSSYSDAVGVADRRLVYLARYDIDNADADGNRFTGGDEGIVWVRVAIEGSDVALDSLKRW